jgi:hypothetical protein
MGTMTLAEFRANCNEWTGTFTTPCGDWEPLGATALTAAGWGDRAGGAVSAVERAPQNTGTLWAATSNGRVFISKNAAADPASAVTFLRLDSLSTVDPERFITGLTIDPQNSNRAWIAYSGFSAATPTTPGHIFRVTYDPSSGNATWTSLDGSLGDLPLTDVARDDENGDLYVSSDFGVLRKHGGGPWVTAADGMPNVEVAGLTMVSEDSDRHGDDLILYAASHGLGAWKLEIDH